MFCRSCGKQIPDGSNVCPNCGTQLSGDAVKNVENFVDSVASKVDNTTNQFINTVGQNFSNNSYGGGARLLKTDRSLLVFILLNFITCGIYSFFFIHNMAKDVNEACRNDNEVTPGVGMFILTWALGIVVGAITGLYSVVNPETYQRALEAASYYGDYGSLIGLYSARIVPMIIVSIIQGVYPLYWRFKLGNKLQRNAQQYGIYIGENGSTVLIWDIIGIVCCCLGTFFAWNVLIKNTNMICMSHNSKHVLKNN